MLSLRAMSADTSTNPLLVRNALPKFDAISPQHVGPAVASVLAAAEQRVAQLRQQQQIDFDWALQLEDVRQSISQVFSPIAHMSRVVSSPGMRDAYNDCLPKITDFMTRLGQDPELLRGYKELARQPAVAEDSTRAELVRHALRDLRLAGIGLPTAEQTEFREIMQTLAKKEAAFEQNLMDATDAFSWQCERVEELEGLPASLIATAADNAGEQGTAGYHLKLDPPTSWR